MAVDFSAFDKQIDLKALQKELQEADDSQYEDVPNGVYDVTFDKMEVKPTKKGDKLMFSVQCSILEGKYKKRKIFFNRTISGNTSERWTNGQAIKSVCTWLDKLETQTIPKFVSYADFTDCVLDIFQEVQGKVGANVTYDASNFNPITINEAFDM